MSDNLYPPRLPADSPLVPLGDVPPTQVDGSASPSGPALQSDLSDGQWHRLHPLTPLLQGGIVLIVLFGIILSNMQGRLVGIFFPADDIDQYVDEFNADPIDWVLANNLWLAALGVIAGLLLVFIGGFYLSWRFHKFRISEADVEVTQGILFRKHRRAPLDRVQGVNLTRPFIARLIGLAKLEVVGAGNDANVPLEYLTTRNAELVRADILRLASGARVARAQQRGDVTAAQRAHLLDTFGAGVTGLVSGAETPVGEPESVVSIPTGRLIGSTLVSTSTLGLIALAAVIVVMVNMTDQPWILFSLVPAFLAIAGVNISQLFKSLRYSIAPTPDGVRVVFGLTTTVTEILPPGRVHALAVTQSVLWRPFGWYRVRLIRLSGKNINQGQVDQFQIALPVGKRADVEKVLSLLMPDVAASDWSYAFEHGARGPRTGDPFTVTPKRAWFIRPLSFKRNGFLMHPRAIMLRRGQIWRSLAIFPLARVQSVAMTQGPIDRLLSVGTLQVHTVMGSFTGNLGAIDRDALLSVWAQAEAGILAAGNDDHTHRWGASVVHEAEPVGPVSVATADPQMGETV
ncbi:PH domain-containing protein [Microbacterium sp. NC79]|uniref:PH domain-containing protein n=1 Tax=Microbacterium sp. NC79 TaxID=2851009 RepID=UPI001C2C1724|nr:PH domain-containing protein [Microbacterium sp. NC79]